MLDVWQLAVAQIGSRGGTSPWMWIIPIAIVVLIVVANAVRVLKEYERGGVRQNWMNCCPIEKRSTCSCRPLWTN
jgi:hypothetical protein